MRLAALLALLALPAFAQEGVPDRRVAISRDVDFYGSDLATLFDVTLDACQAACVGDPSCRAFTFNQSRGACFPKSGVSEVVPFAGAISGRVLDTDPLVLARAPARAGDLGFLDSGEVAAAGDLAAGLGRQHSSDELAPADLLAAAAEREGAGDVLGAFRFTGAAVALTDEGWDAYARLALMIQPADDEGYAARARAVPAAVAAYLRSPEDGRAAALGRLAEALEADGRGRTAIPALRLAARLSPGYVAALDRAVELYGFNLVESVVDSDAAQPRVCALFNEPLRAGTDYAPFVGLADGTLTVTAQDAQLCVEGVSHGQRVSLTLREGLPAASGETLARDVPLDLYVRDRQPAVRVLSRAFVLPRGGDAAIPVETVNVDAVDLRLSRVSDGNLVRSLIEGSFGAPQYGWERDMLADTLGTTLWEGQVAVRAGEVNREVVTEVPLADLLAGEPPGLYALAASVPGVSVDEQPATAQWFVLTDLGLATFQGSDGITVAVRSLEDASGVEGAEVVLMSRANAELGRAVTDAEGVAVFEAGLARGTGGAAPAAVVARAGEGDMAFLSLTDPAFDLSDRGVEGRPAGGPLDAFLTTDRGAYRAGETVHALALLRDRAAAAVAAPLTAIVTRPDGVEHAREVSSRDAAGGHVWAFALNDNVQRGTWTLGLYADPEGEPLSEASFLVEDFVPERIDVVLDAKGGRLGEPLAARLQADFLWGAPGAALAVEGEVTLAAAEAVPGWEGWSFGLHDAPVAARVESFGDLVTDEGGAAVLALALPAVEGDVAQPLEARVAVRVLDESGRPVERRATVPVAPSGPVLGLRVPEGVAEGARAEVGLVALSPDLAPVAMPARWRVDRLETTYQWYEVEGSWNWEPVTRRERIAEGEVALDGPATIAVPVTWGAYEVTIEGDGTAASATFSAGWYAAPGAEAAPDRLAVSLDAPAYAPGDVATLRIDAEGAGVALVSVLTDRVVALEVVAVDGPTEVSLPVTEEWGAGAYVAAHLLRPLERGPGEGRLPTRSLGLAHAGVAPGDRALTVTLEAPLEARPREPMTLAVDVGLPPGETAYVALAAADAGILNLTGFEPPDPSAHFFGQRRLGVELRDLYGRIIADAGAETGTLREGGDAQMMAQRSEPPTEALLAFFEGPVEVGPDGRATVTFDLPAFNGTVRVWAVAWSPTGVGQATADVLVRDPAVLTASLPRVLSPGDEATLRLDLALGDGAPGAYAVEVAGAGLSATLAADLAEGAPWRGDVPLMAGEAGMEIAVTVVTPAGERLSRALSVPVVARDPEVARTSRVEVAPGEAFTLDDAVLAGLVPGTAEATLSIGPLARLDAAGLLAALDRSAWGCTEQVTSKAMPLLALGPVAEALGLAPEGADEEIAEAIGLILANQASNGGFGLWGPYGGDLWLDAYVTDFLSRARAAGHDVPEVAWTLAIDNLANSAASYGGFEYGGEGLAYALLVLAREGRALVGDLRYYADTKAESFATPLALAQLGAALASIGDQVRADALFAAAQARLDAESEPFASVWRADYGTERRDAAAILTLAAEAGSGAVDAGRLASEVGTATGPASTQEAAWTLLAAAALAGDLQGSGVTVDGVVPDVPVLRLAAGDAPMVVRNGGTEAMDLTVTTLGVPEVPEPAGGTGWAIDRAYYTLEGTPADPSVVARGDRLVAVLTVTPQGFQAARLMVSDPLPGGFEIDNANLLSGGSVEGLPWLQPAVAQHEEARFDRYLAAVDWQSDQPFQVAYVVRAVSPGTFHHPAALVEDMYRPAMRAQTDAGSVVVE